MLKVQIRVRLQCQPLSEVIFKEAIADNYYTNNHFWFELDHGQSRKLVSLLASSAFSPGAYMPHNKMKWRTVSRPLPSHEASMENEAFNKLTSEAGHSTRSTSRCHSSEDASSTDTDKYIEQSDDPVISKEAEQDEKSLVLMKLKELALNRESQTISLPDNVKDTPDVNVMKSSEKGCMEASTGFEKKEECTSSPFEHQSIITQVLECLAGISKLLT